MPMKLDFFMLGISKTYIPFYNIIFEKSTADLLLASYLH